MSIQPDTHVHLDGEDAGLRHVNRDDGYTKFFEGFTAFVIIGGVVIAAVIVALLLL